MAHTGVPVAPRPLHRLDEPRGPEARQQFLEEHPQLEARQVRAEAVMHPLAEAQVRIRFTRDVERVWFGENQTVAVGRAFPDLHLLPGRDLAPCQFDVTCRSAALRR